VRLKTSEATLNVNPFCLRDEPATRRRIVQAFSSPELLVPIRKGGHGEEMIRAVVFARFLG